MKRKVISPKSLPTKLPVWQTLVAFLALEYWDAREWIYGACGLFFFIIWLTAIINIIREQRVDIFDKDKK